MLDGARLCQVSCVLWVVTPLFVSVCVQGSDVWFYQWLQPQSWLCKRRLRRYAPAKLPVLATATRLEAFIDTTCSSNACMFSRLPPPAPSKSDRSEFLLIGSKLVLHSLFQSWTHKCFICICSFLGFPGASAKFIILIIINSLVEWRQQEKKVTLESMAIYITVYIIVCYLISI